MSIKDKFASLNLNELTYGEFKDLFPSTKRVDRFPCPKDLRTSNLELLVEQPITNGKIEVYENGYFIYRSLNHETVFAVDKCLDMISCRWHGNSKAVVDELKKGKWLIPLVMCGEDRIQKNAYLFDLRFLSSEELESDYQEKLVEEMDQNLFYNPFEEAEGESEDVEQKKQIVKAALACLTDRQREVFLLKVKYPKLSQSELAHRLGIVQQVFSKIFLAAERKIKKFLENL